MINRIKFNTKEDKLNHLKSLNSIPSINPKEYDENCEYYRLDFIYHPQHGCGFIEKIISDSRFVAFFEEGEIELSQKAYLKRA